MEREMIQNLQRIERELNKETFIPNSAVCITENMLYN